MANTFVNRHLRYINMYLNRNDLFDSVSFIGGDNTQCKVQMSLNAELYRFIKTMKKYTNCRISLKLNKPTDEGIITFRRYR